MAITGVIADTTRSKIPEAWQYCLSHPGYGEASLQRSIDLTKYLLFNTVVAPGTESSVYNKIIVEYAGLLAAARIIPSAAEIINNASYHRVMTGQKNGQETYLNRYENLMKRKEELLKEAEELYPFIKDQLDPAHIAVNKSPVDFSTTLNDALSDNPEDFDYTYDERVTKFPLERDGLV